MTKIQITIAGAGLLIGRGSSARRLFGWFRAQSRVFGKATSSLARRVANPCLIDRTLMRGPPPLAHFFREGPRIVF